MAKENNLRLEWRDPKKLADNPANWRLHPPAQEAALRDTLAEVGWAGALLYNERTGRLIDGHLRKQVATGPVPVLVGDWSEAEERKILATLDPLGAMAQFDQDKLLNLLAQVETESGSIKAMMEALANGSYAALVPMPDMEPKGLTDPDDVPPVPEESYVKRGDIWQLGDHRIMCGDSTKLGDIECLLQGVISNLMVTDPPYGVGYETEGRNPRWRRDNKPIVNDNLGVHQEEFWRSAFLAWPLEGDCYVFAPPGPLSVALTLAIIAAGIEHHQWLIWAKDRFALGRSHYHYRHEHIFYGWKGNTSWQGRRDEDSVWECPRPMRSPEHPTMKPVALLERAIRNSSMLGNIVVDPFLGSGSTVIACQKLGRICYGMEIEPWYVEVTIERWQNFTGRKAVKIA